MLLDVDVFDVTIHRRQLNICCIANIRYPELILMETYGDRPAARSWQ